MIWSRMRSQRSEQAVVQVKNTVFNYTEDMSDIMQMICANIQKEEEEANNFSPIF